MDIIKTERLLLKKMKFENYIELFNIWNDNELIKYTNHPYVETLEGSKKYISEIIQWYMNSKSHFGPFILYYEEKFVGFCGLDLKSESINEFELFYIILRNYWGNGFATEVSKKLIGIGFEYLNAQRIIAEAFPENSLSWKLLEKIGMKKEGCIRREFFKDHKFHDLYIYSILKDEWIKKL